MVRGPMPEVGAGAVSARQTGSDAFKLTGAVVRIPSEQEGLKGSRHGSDMGLGVILDGSKASASQVLELGSATIRVLDLSRRLVVVDRLPGSVLGHLQSRFRPRSGERDSAMGDRAASELADTETLPVALGVLRRRGFDPLLRPVFLKVGFRDICRDLDPHEGQAVRVLVEGERVAWAHLDCESVAVVVRTAQARPDPALERALAEAFPQGRHSRFRSVETLGFVIHRVGLPAPWGTEGLRTTVEQVRDGLLKLLEVSEPERWASVNQVLRALGPRDTLASLSPDGGTMVGGEAAPEAAPATWGSRLVSPRVH